MHIRAGYELSFNPTQPTPILLLVSVHPSRAGDLLTPGFIGFDPPTPARAYQDGFDNVCTRVLAPAGPFTVSTDFVTLDSGQPDEVAPNAVQHPVEDLPDDVLVYLLGSRYCETDRLTDTAWSLFGHTRAGWDRVQSICDFVHNHLTFNYQNARATRTAWEGYQERIGVCRDFAHLAVTFCRCMNIPARYCTGYLGDIGVPPLDAPGDFSAWFDVYLSGRWYTFDARHNVPRIGRILMARGRDATDVAISTSFGSAPLTGFRVFTDEVPS
jgi:transglutaminase-like putative cysteine protease